MTWLEIFLTALIFFLGSAVQGFFGFGFGIIAMAGLTLSVDVVHAAGVVNVAGLLNTAWMAYRLRDHISWRLVGRIVPTLFLGVAIGVTALGAFDAAMMASTLGIVIIGVAGWNLTSPSLSKRDSLPLDASVGLVGGMLSGAFNTGGPPLVAHLFRRPDPPDVLKSTLQILFFASGMARLPMAAGQGMIDAEVLRDAAVAVPTALVGVLVGVRLAQRLSPERFRVAGWIALGALGVALIARG